MNQEKDAAILRIAASDQSNELNEMLLQGRSLSGRERNCVFLNTLSSDDAKGRFATISAVSGMDFPDDGQAAAQVDWDHDGDLDLMLTNRTAPRVRFMRNENPSGNGYIQFLLRGNGTDTNRDAIGARVVVTLDETNQDGDPVRLLKTLRAGDGYLTQSSKCLHFGLGATDKIKQVEIRWPNRQGESVVIEDLEANHRYEITQGSPEAKKIPPREKASALVPEPTKVPEVESTMRIPLIKQFRAPAITYQNFENQTEVYSRPENQMVLVNLWSSSCAPCVKELKEFSLRHQELLDAGVNVLALNIDTLQEVPNATAEAKAMADRMNFSFPAGMASPEVIEELQRLHNSLLQMNRPLPMPTSFLIDQQGFLHTIYKGAVSVDTLLEDGQSQPADLLERFQRAVVRKGTVLEGPIVSEAMLRNEGAALMRLGKDYLKEGKLARAEDILKDALVKMPDTVAIHNQLAILYEQAARRGVPGKINLAKKHYLDAIAIEPDKPTLRTNLAQLLIQQRAFDEAAVHLKHALENAPATADAHYNMGMIYSSKRDVDNEKISYEKALEINPEHPQALYRLGRIFEQQQANDEAQAYYRRAVNQAAGNPLVVTSLARVLISSSENNEARQLLETVIRNQPRYPDAHYQLGRLYLNSGRPEDAEQKFLDTLKIKRNHPGATRALRDLQMSGQSPSP